MLHDEVMRPPVITGDVRSDIAKLRTYLYGLSEQLQNVFDSIRDDEKNAKQGRGHEAGRRLERIDNQSRGKHQASSGQDRDDGWRDLGACR